MKQVLYTRLAIVVLWLLTLPGTLSADPAWWAARGVVNTNLQAADFSALTSGQVKWMATNACLELEACLPGGAGSNVWSLVRGFSATNNYLPVNAGQLKNLARIFYEQMWASGFRIPYPWTTNTVSDDADFAAANVGQLKNLFGFDLCDPGLWDENGLSNATVFVNAAATGTQNGSSNHPFATIAQGLNLARTQPRPVIHLAPGLYLGTNNCGLNVDFPLVMYGGSSTSCVIDCAGANFGLCFSNYVWLTGLTIRNASGGSAGVALSANSSTRLSDCRFGGAWVNSDLPQSASGSVVRVSHGPLRMERCVVGGSVGTNGQAGVYCDGCPSVTLDSCLISGNELTGGDGIVMVDCPDVSIRYSTVAYNIGCRGARVEGEGSCLRISDSIFWDNDSEIEVGEDVAPDGVSVTNCYVQGGCPEIQCASNVFTVSPLVSRAGMLLPGSPCINAGMGAPYATRDLFGISRDVQPDIGCSEFRDANYDGNDDRDQNGDGLPDDWELSWLPSLDYRAWGDANGNGVPNDIEYLRGTDPNATLDVKTDYSELQTLYWSPDSRATQYAVNVFREDGSVCDSRTVNTTSYAFNAGGNGNCLRATVTAMNGAANKLWTRKVEWQPVGWWTEVTAWLITPAFTNQWPTVSAGSIFMNKTIPAERQSAWDTFYVSSNPDGSGGWTPTGIDLYVSYQLVASNTDKGVRLSANWSSSVSVQLRTTGSSTAIGLTGPLYLIRWRPSLSGGMSIK